MFIEIKRKFGAPYLAPLEVSCLGSQLSQISSDIGSGFSNATREVMHWNTVLCYGYKTGNIIDQTKN